MHNMELGLVGNGTVGALIDERAEVVWYCLPRFDGDPVFCSLLREAGGTQDFGYFRVELTDAEHSEQHYIENTAVLVTTLVDKHGGAVEITDFAPRFEMHERLFNPMMLMRRVRRLSGNPRITVKLRPAWEYGAQESQTTRGSHHVRYVGPTQTLRLTTDASITAVQSEATFFLEGECTFILGPDETIQGSVHEHGRQFLERTIAYWRSWVRSLNIPFEWQEAVIRAAITLKLNAFEDTGAIIAAMTTSLPEAAGEARNWDYRACWLRDAYFVVNALNRLGTTATMERYLRWIANVAAGGDGQSLKPVYAIDGKSPLDERIVPDLPGYRGFGPVRVGNQAGEQIQHDVYGSVVLAAAHVFFDHRLDHRGDEAMFRRLEQVGELAIHYFDKPDAGIWELRGSMRVHTFSSVMCWAACDRLARIGAHLALSERAEYWRTAADRIHARICTEGWNEALGAFTASWGGDTLDASLLLINEVDFLPADDPRFASTVAAIERGLKRGDFVFRYVERDDFGTPENAFLVCTFWYLYALVALNRQDEARTIFERLLACRTRNGLFAEHIDVKTHEQWGNFVQTYSMVGVINSAIRLSRRWDQAF
ncbi:glycoside hydrolase family 15 protein [Niveibacterium sp. SC-1]|uniref:glycoside hydrolase family 15 protein n=1 Tax=Niveibacterium sp. SC-1 TaxID=3135646 RepID=UPI00311DF517